MPPTFRHLAAAFGLAFLSACSSLSGPNADDGVRDLLGDAMVAVIAAPDTVSVATKQGLVPLSSDSRQVQKLRGLVFDYDSYVPQIAKKCRFRPKVAFVFVKQTDKAEVALDTSCKMWRFTMADKTVFEDFDPVAGEIAEILKSLEMSSKGAAQ